MSNKIRTNKTFSIFLIVIAICLLGYTGCTNVTNKVTSITPSLDHDPILLVHGFVPIPGIKTNTPGKMASQPELIWDKLSTELTSVETNHIWTDGGTLMANSNRAKVADFYKIRFSSGSLNFDDQGKELQKVVENIHSATGHNVILVCHSMGGLAARDYLESSGIDKYVSGLITIGTPNTGSYLAYLPDAIVPDWIPLALNTLVALNPSVQGLMNAVDAVEWYKNFRPAIDYLKPDSKQLAELNNNLHNLPLNVPYICITSKLPIQNNDPLDKLSQEMIASTEIPSFFSKGILDVGDGVVPFVSQDIKSAALNKSSENLKWTQEANITYVSDLDVSHGEEPKQTTTILKALQSIINFKYNFQATSSINVSSLTSTVVSSKLWDKTFGGSGDAFGNSIIQSVDDGFVIVGAIEATDSYGAVRWDAWMIKTDANGNKLWDKTFGGSGRDEAKSIIQSGDGGFIIIGTTRSYGAGNQDAWLIKTDANGNKLWDKTFGGSGADYGNSIIQSADDGFVIVGATDSYGAGNQDAWLIKTDANGNKLWDKTFGGSDSDEAKSIIQSGDGGFIISGFIGYSDEYSKGKAWLFKIDANGKKLWDKTFDDKLFGGISAGFSIIQSGDGGFIMTGRSDSSGNGDVWLIKTDANGNKLWDKTFGGLGFEYGNSIIQSRDGGFMIIGGSDSSDNRYAWLIKTDANGNKLWDKTFGGSGYDYGNSIIQSRDGGFVIVGFTTSYGADKEGVWLIKFGYVSH